MKFSQFVTIMLAMSATCAGLIYQAFDSHGSQPHIGAATAREYDALRYDINELRVELREMRQIIIDRNIPG